VDASDRLYLARAMPFLLVWGEHDSLIPVAHGHAAHQLVPGSRLEVFAESGHFPQLDEPARFTDVLIDFIETTDPVAMDPAGWREVLLTGRDAA
jgi:pimeloyl-ACP methyl ester carboxylesterase